MKKSRKIPNNAVNHLPRPVFNKKCIIWVQIKEKKMLYLLVCKIISIHTQIILKKKKTDLINGVSVLCICLSFCDFPPYHIS